MSTTVKHSVGVSVSKGAGEGKEYGNVTVSQSYSGTEGNSRRYTLAPAASDVSIPVNLNSVNGTIKTLLITTDAEITIRLNLIGNTPITITPPSANVLGMLLVTGAITEIFGSNAGSVGAELELVFAD